MKYLINCKDTFTVESTKKYFQIPIIVFLKKKASLYNGLLFEPIDNSEWIRLCENTAPQNLEENQELYTEYAKTYAAYSNYIALEEKLQFRIKQIETADGMLSRKTSIMSSPPYL